MEHTIYRLFKRVSILVLCLTLAACGSSSSNEDDIVETEEQQNTSPEVDAGTGQTVDAGDTVTLLATVTDDDASYTLLWSQTSGDEVSLSNTSSESTTFTAPSSDTEQALVFVVSVDDGTNPAVTDSVTITVNAQVVTDTAPTVDAGSDQTVAPGDTVVLAAIVTDDSEDFSIVWSQSSGSNTVALADNTAESTSFTAPDEEDILVFEVTVNDGVNDAASDTVTVTISNEDTPLVTSEWIINQTNEVSEYIIDSTTGVGVLVDVQSVTEETVSGEDYIVVSSQGIPKYDVTITQDIIDGINDRPKASSDLASGATTMEVGDVVKFGQDIGYNSNNNCSTNAGYGYWPPGPDCPTEDERNVYLPVEPTETTEECENGLGKVGLFVNGSSIYNWGDGMSYLNQGDWQTLAPVAEFYDVDICGGHAANGDYHHHFYTSCLADLVGDQGDTHSPLYGYAADGYPIYGPWEDDGTLAVSAWVTRDYNADSETGCDDGQRSCTLVDQYDISLGTETATPGPGFDEEVETLSGNVLTATNGYYYEDHYWDSSLTEQGGVYLDQYNGHTDETLGYHYHITLTIEDGVISPAFPYIIGTRFAGELQDNAITSCQSGDTTMGPPP